MIKKGTLITLLHFIIIYPFLAQPIFPENGIVFNDGVVPRIDIRISKDSLMDMLKSENLQNDHEYPADFFWNDGTKKDTVLNIGFRLRGNTSRISAKKSFKVAFNHFGSKKFYGLSELNLNGEHNDPSIVRSKICWDMMRLAGIEAPRSNHIALYINNEYRGLYINVEHIDNEYLEARNKDSDGQLFKLYYGCDFTYKGNNPNNYDRNIYEAANNKNDPDYYSLMEFTRVLNDSNNPEFRCILEDHFDIDDYLKRMALEILFGHWDNPIFNKNNGYLYLNPSNNKFQLISYDIDNTYGIDWFGINWANRNIYSWANTTSPRPIFNNLMAVPEYKIRFGHFVKSYIDSFFNASFLNPYLDNIKKKISPFRINDVYAEMDYGYSYNDFLKSYDISTGAHVKFGLKEYIDIRSSSAKNQLQSTNISPIIEHQLVKWNNTTCIFNFQTQALSPLVVTGKYKLGSGNWNDLLLLDDGKYPDTQSQDGRYSMLFNYSDKTSASIRILAKETNGKNSTWPVCNDYTFQLGYDNTPLLVINEFMADNSKIKDESGEYEDWIEIYNAGSTGVWLGDKYLSDNANSPDKWTLPPIELEPNKFLIVWADEDQSQGENHTNFKLNKSGEFIGIFDNKENSFAPIDTFTYASTMTDIAYGRYPDGQGKIIKLNKPTLGISNVTTFTNESQPDAFVIFPNPGNQYITVRNTTIDDIISLSDISGRMIERHTLAIKDKETIIDVSDLQQGVYMLKIKRHSTNYSYKLIKL